ncbi:transcription factor/nuclear export subunit protein 2-domain-containing protein [Crepidotus variabilis]|uniref:THO complex subunit 2 n=1 Tax=Crepidotus variabilis TaxID=179855 RepID=A0A9P6ET93_9AGAR|nr:transcription factor/nuclear export subunit protein 2-domain-containing protein [Crepidotus variabilis]
MDFVSKARECLRNWPKGGEAECRKLLIGLHAGLNEPNAIDALTTVYHTLLCATLPTWTPTSFLTPIGFVDFVNSIASSLPSSSNSAKQSSNASIFGEILVDMIWSLDAELDELLVEARTAATVTIEHTKLPARDHVLLTSKAKKSQQTVEGDKQRLPIIVKKLLELRIITPALCRERLETSILANAGLIPDKMSQDKKEVRVKTGLFYKQNKFNLLREQSEGYSKLVVELTSSLGPPHSPSTGRPAESYTAIEERARPVWEKVISLVGYFDLDPNRALDIILDVLSQHLATHYTFFLVLLSFSPWAGSYRRPLREDELMDTTTDIPPGTFKGQSLDEILTTVEEHSLSRTTPCLPKVTDARVLAQVLGFKFVFYQSADIAESVPKNLYLTAAILVREGFIALEDLYPHLHPEDEGMQSFRKEYDEDIQNRIAGAKNSLLAMAAPLESAGSSQSKTKPPPAPEPKKAEVKDTNQKIGLLVALLSVGALRAAVAIVTKFPWLVDLRPEIADLMIRVIKVSMEPLYDAQLVTKDRNPSFNHPKSRYGPSGVSFPAAPKPILTLSAPAPPGTNTTDFVFFYPDWVDRVPISNTLDDLQDVIEPLLRLIGIHVSRDALFLTKFLRLGRIHLLSTVPLDPDTKKPAGEADPEHPIRQFWFAVLRRYLLPALTLIRGNAVCTVEIWAIIRQYETTARWKLYGEWKDQTYKSHPELRIRAVQADREAKGILRRLSHNTIDSLSGPVAKLAHSNPCIIFQNAVNQIMAYENLAQVVIQALRYVTNMGFDVLVFVVLAAFANPDKERVKDDGVNASDWLQSLASFTGMLFRRFSADLSPVLKYVVHQLHNGQASEIIVLRELIWKMAGIEPLPSLAESQMAAMAGGPALRMEAIASETRGARLDPADAVLKGPQRLGRGLLDSKLALPLLIQVAQQRQACVYKAPNTHLKALAGLYDATHGVLLQYLELLTSEAVMSPEDYADKILPSLAELGELYGVCAPICMQIIRPVLNASLMALVLKDTPEETERRLKAALTAKREPNGSSSRVASPVVKAQTPEAAESKPKLVEEKADVPMELDNTGASAGLGVSKETSPWIPELERYFDDIKKIAPKNVYEVIGPAFYVTFWQLSMYDLAPPGTKYEEESTKLRSLSRQEDTKYTAADRSTDRNKRLTANAHRTKRDRFNKYVDLLGQELNQQTMSRQFTIKRLAKEKLHWFAHCPRAQVLCTAIYEHCIQARCLLSPMDADFCAHFLHMLHTQGTPGFHTLGLYDKILGDHVKVVLFSCSEYEARNYGRFLATLLRQLLLWHDDEGEYISDHRTTRGGKPVCLPGMLKVFQKEFNKPVDAQLLMPWPDYQKVIRKWYRKLATGFVECLQSREFMHVYNSIVVLKEILDVFPLASVNDTGTHINAAMDRLVETEARGDLKVLARSYSASLKKKEVDWLPKKSQIRNATSSRPSPQAVANEKHRGTPTTSIPTGPSSQSLSANDVKRANPPPTAPSAPRGIANNASATENGSHNVKAALDSIPRPEVVRRVRPDSKVQDAAKMQTDGPLGSALKPDVVSSTGRPIAPTEPGRYPQSNTASSTSSKDGPLSNGRDTPDSSRLQRPLEPSVTSQDNTPPMPPPAVPSQTASAQELRETARQTLGRSERLEVKAQNGPSSISPRPRSQSPPSRPGTRNTSNESRTSGGKSASNADRGSDDRRSDRDTHLDVRESISSSSLARRDSLTHTRSERRERGSDEKDSERDKERGRERHPERDRDREHRDRDRDRERGRERERERERDRERDRDRHRRDDKDRDRDSKKERETAGGTRGQAGPSNVAAEERMLPTRPERQEASRQDNSKRRDPPPVNSEDNLGKRRRPPDDESDRAPKRSSRKDGHRDDRSGRRLAEKDREERGRDADRRRKDRDPPINEGSSTADKPSDKQPPEGPKVPNAPSGPRMRADSHRMKPEPTGGRNSRDSLGRGPAPTGPNAITATPSLQSRISNGREPPSASRAEGSRHEEDLHRKRTLSDRGADVDMAGPEQESSPNPQKRPRGNGARPRLGGGHGSAFARKTLPLDGDRGQRKQD